MSKVEFRPVLPEPAHPMIVKLHDDLRVLYTHIREYYQAEIDQTFDRVSREIGFVVATAVPVKFKVGDERVMGIIIVDGRLQDTLFSRELIKTLETLMDGNPIPPIPEGTYHLYLFWYEALKMKLRTDWMEPAHVARRRMAPSHLVTERAPREVIWEAYEPAHWFDPGITMPIEEAVLVSVIDEVYPELRLADRVGYYRRGTGQLAETPGLARAGAQNPTPEPAQPPAEMLTELAALLRRYGY